MSRVLGCVQTKVEEWFKAFAEHPRLGDLETLRAKVGGFASLSRGEQAASASTATESILQVGPSIPNSYKGI
jgi:hypothetical protein